MGPFSIITSNTDFILELLFLYISTYSYSVKTFESKGKGCLSNIRHARKLACGSFVEDRGGGEDGHIPPLSCCLARAWLQAKEFKLKHGKKITNIKLESG